MGEIIAIKDNFTTSRNNIRRGKANNIMKTVNRLATKKPQAEYYESTAPRGY